jgi:hypothetical protein
VLRAPLRLEGELLPVENQNRKKARRDAAWASDWLVFWFRDWLVMWEWSSRQPVNNHDRDFAAPGNYFAGSFLELQVATQVS